MAGTYLLITVAITYNVLFKQHSSDRKCSHPEHQP